MTNFCIIDYGLGNVRSVKNAFEKLKVNVCISSDKKQIQSSSHLILPGVGSFESGMEGLKSRGLIDLLNEEILNKKKPVLGICLGMQLFASKSFEHGNHDGLNWISGTIEKIDDKNNQLRLPHMGWNETNSKSGFILTKRLKDKPIFYFVHNYHFLPTDQKVISSTCEYGEKIVSSVENKNIFGVQFHPEKSHDDGFVILKNFIKVKSSYAKD
jgi:imidazole glycerol-phosphate synthase subunit HisH|tara:strand:+ start:104 stop:742 length:639 start_codon:yes stop_codon:yes gene_type:complete